MQYLQSDYTIQWQHNKHEIASGQVPLVGRYQYSETMLRHSEFVNLSPSSADILSLKFVMNYILLLFSIHCLFVSTCN